MSQDRHTIVCLSSQPWQDGMWTNKQHIMSRLARHHRVLHVNFGPKNLKELIELKRSATGAAPLHPIRLVADPHERQQDGVTVLDFYAPLWGGRRFGPEHPARIFTTFDLRLKLLSRYLSQQRIEDAIIWVYHPGYGPEVARLPHRLIVYDCVDEYSEFPEYKGDAAWLERRERQLCGRADVVFTTSQGLFDVKKALNPDNTYLVHNVGDSEHFSKARDDDTRVPPDLAGIRKPVIGFVGAVSAYKLNSEWLLALAAQRPDWSIVLIGPAGVGDPDTDASKLDAVPNIHLLGHRPYQQLPAYVKGFDVAVIPYRNNRYTDYCFPIKFFEFLATGRPVVISKLPALAKYYDAVLVADNVDSFVERCEEALRDPESGHEQRIALAAKNNWAARVERLMEQVERRLVG